jgi:hypothetical protein
VPPPHHGRVEPLFDHRPCAGLDHRFAAQQGRAMDLVIEIGFDPVGLFLGEQARFRMRMGQPQTLATREHVFDRNSPFIGQCFYPLSRHLVYFIPASACYPVAFGSIPLSDAFRQGSACAAMNETPSLWHA